MARGQRTNLASLANSVGDHSPVEQTAAMTSHTAPLSDLTPNPRNPRDDLGDLSGLESIADMQLQPAVVVTKSAYLTLYLAIVVNDDIARDRITLISASIAENVDRQDFDVIEEAKAVESLVKECGSGHEAANRLHKTEAWVSQRRALLSLAPELQTALRRGELAIREARSLARVPLEQQVVRWRAAQDKKNNDGHNGTTDGHSPSPSRIIATALREFPAKPQLLAEVLRTHLGPDGVKTLLAALADEPATV